METLISIANESIAKTSTSNKHNTPWFNDDCRKAISTTSNSPGQKHENSLRKPRRKVGKTISTNWAPLPKPTESGG